MGSFGIIIATLVFVLPLMIGLWVGVSGLRQHGRNKANCCMTIGLTLTTLLPIIMAVTTLATIWRDGFNIPALSIMGLLTVSGAVLFSIGFALHGQSIRRIHQRTSELELLSLAQATELERLRNR